MSALCSSTHGAMLASTSLLPRHQRPAVSILHRDSARGPMRQRWMSMATSSNAAVLADMYKGFAAQFPGVKGYNAKQVHDLIQGPNKDNVVLIDVRTDGEREVSMLPGTVLTKEEFERRKEEFKTHQLITYCTAGYRSGKYAEQLGKEGFNVLNFEGSILAWTHEGYPLVTGPNRNEPTKRVHVFAEKWLIQGDGYEPVVYKNGQGVLATVATTVKGAVPKWLGGK